MNKKVMLDTNYNIKVNSTSAYVDSTDEIVETILKAQEDKIISSDDAALLLGLALRIGMKKEISSWFKTIVDTPQRSEKHTMFLQLNTHSFDHAS